MRKEIQMKRLTSGFTITEESIPQETHTTSRKHTHEKQGTKVKVFIKGEKKAIIAFSL
jgi:hypothetical protein